MKLIHALAVLLLSVAVQAQTFTTVTATNIQNAFGQKLASGQVCFQAVNNNGVPISFRAGNSGQVMNRPVCAAVINGAFSVSLPDTSLTTPANVCYRVTVKDSSTNQIVLGNALPGQPSGYDCLQPSGASFNFDTYTPNLGALVAVVAPQGPPGPAGPAGPPGPTGTVSAAGDGSYAAPAISFASDNALGLYKAAAGQMGLAGTLTAPGLADPVVTVVPQGTPGTKTWQYVAVARGADGAVAPSTLSTWGTVTGMTSTGNATLNISNYNALTWNAIAGASSYDVYRTYSDGVPASTGKIANVTTSTYNDQGAAGDSTAPPSANNTGTITARRFTIQGANCGAGSTWSGCAENTIYKTNHSGWALAIKPASGSAATFDQSHIGAIGIFNNPAGAAPSVYINAGVQTNGWLLSSGDMPNWNDANSPGPRQVAQPSPPITGMDNVGEPNMIGCVNDVNGPCMHARMPMLDGGANSNTSAFNTIEQTTGRRFWINADGSHMWGPGPNRANIDLTAGRSTTNTLLASKLASPSIAVTGLLVPVNSTFSAAHNSGTLLASTTYYYRVAALSPCGTSPASTETSITTGTGANDYVITVKWGFVPGAIGYKVYGRTTGAEQLLATVSGGTLYYGDNGSATPSGAVPATDTSICGIIAPLATPATSSATCTAGQILWDAGYVYVCTATNTWKRAALSTF